VNAKHSEEPLTVLKSGPDHIRVAHRLKNHPATTVAGVIERFFRMEGGLHTSAATSAKGSVGSRIALAADPITNSLLVSGPPEAVKEVEELLDKLDQPAGMVLLEMEIGEAPVAAVKAVISSKPTEKSPAAAGEPVRLPQRPEKMETIGRARVVTLDNQPAFVQMGSRVPLLNDATASSASGPTRPNSLRTSFQNVGLILLFTPRINPNEVVMQIDVEKSQLGPEAEGIPISAVGDKVVRSPRIDITTAQATVKIADGQTMILCSAAQGKSDKQLVVIITPHIIGLEEAKRIR